MQRKCFVDGPKAVPRDAAEWCARMHSDDVTQTDHIAFADWLAAGVRNRSDYEACRKVMHLARGLAGRSDLEAALGLSDLTSPTAKKRFEFRPALIAASVAGLLFCGGMWGWLQQNRTLDYATLIGEQETVTLEDGSLVELNTDSRINVALGGNERQVVLQKGEAFFEVAPNRERPFVIETSQGEIRVVGTKFNVRVDGDKTIVTVAEGHVRVALGPPDGRKQDGAGFVDLLADDQMWFDAEGHGQKQSGADLAKAVAWRHGQIYFDNASLRDVVDELNRYNARKYVIADADVAALRLSGVFKAGDTNALLFVLRETFGINVLRQSSSVIEIGSPDSSQLRG